MSAEVTQDEIESEVRRRGSTGQMDRVTVRLSDTHLDALDELVEAGVYPNRSEAIRAAVRTEVRRGESDGD